MTTTKRGKNNDTREDDRKKIKEAETRNRDTSVSVSSYRITPNHKNGFVVLLIVMDNTKLRYIVVLTLFDPTFPRLMLLDVRKNYRY